MALIRKEQGGSGFGTYWWENDGDVVEVHDDDFAVEVSRNRWPGFSIYDDDRQPPTEPTEKTPAETLGGDLEEDPEGDSMGGPDGDARDDGSDVPAGSVASIVAWVGDDVDRARAALAAESDRRTEPRPTLVQQLTAIING